MKSILRLPLLATLFSLALPLAGRADEMPPQYYSIEEIPLPKEIAPEIGGLAFNSKGEIVVVLRRHGIWIGTPAANPSEFRWRVFSDASLHNPMGVLLESDTQMLVPHMSELLRISDTNGDGVADRYENISNAWGVSGNYHETNAGPIPDGQGNWYIAIGTASHNGPTFDWVRGEFSRTGRRGRNFSAVAWKGWVVKITPNGDLIPWGSGFRANNGIALNPAGDLFVTDNEGDWRGGSPIHHVEKGGFYGHPSSLVWDANFYPQNGDPLDYGLDRINALRTRPVVELPKGILCNSPAEPIFDTTGGNFGPFAGQMFVGDISSQRIIRVMLEKVNGKYQGAATHFIERSGLRGGNNRFTWSPDGKSLYVGQTYRGWGRPNEGLQRITWQGVDPFEVKAMNLTPTGFDLTFTRPVDAAAAASTGAFQFRSFHLESSHRYGSSLQDVKQIDVRNVAVSPDGLKVSVSLAEMTPLKIYQLNLTGMKSADGHPLINTMVCYTLNQLKQ